MLREAEGGIVTALSGAETTEIAYALGRLLRAGSERTRPSFPRRPPMRSRPSGSRCPAIAEAELVVVVGDDPVVERAPIVDLWIKEARRRGAEIVVCSPTGTVYGRARRLGGVCRELAEHGTSSASACGQRSGPCSSGPGRAEVAERGSQSSRTSSDSRTSPAAAHSISP